MRKFKCIKNYNSGIFLTKGNIYYEKDGTLEYDDGWVDNNFKYNGSACFVGGILLRDCLEEIKEEKKVNKFKVGDKVRIIGNKSSGHKFNIGEVAKIDKIYNEGTDKEHCMASNESKSYYVSYVDIELFNKSSTKSLTITTSDSTTTLTDGIITVSVNRYYTDKHDEEIAIREVTDKYYGELARIEREKSMPKIGDKVKVIDDERVYSRYDDWLIENNIEYKYALLWQENYSPKNESTGFIRAIYPHLKNKDVILALVETESHAYIINIEGLEVIK